jgi:hypothetical protein
MTRRNLLILSGAFVAFACGTRSGRADASSPKPRLTSAALTISGMR